MPTMTATFNMPDGSILKTEQGFERHGVGASSVTEYTSEKRYYVNDKEVAHFEIDKDMTYKITNLLDDQA